MPPSLYDDSRRFADEAHLKDKFQMASLFREHVGRWVASEAAKACRRCRMGESPQRGGDQAFYHEHERCDASQIRGLLS